MADYIGRQSVYEKIAKMEETARNRYCDTPFNSPAKERYRAQLNERTALKHMIADEPAANVREDVHGEWIDFRGKPQCFNCKAVWPEDYYQHNFCPRCGARMTGGIEE